MDERIVCIRTSGPRTDCSCITHVQTFYNQVFSVIEIIASINRGHKFYVTDHKDSSKTYVMPVEKHGRWCIRTSSTDTPEDNLLKLPDF